MTDFHEAGADVRIPALALLPDGPFMYSGSALAPFVDQEALTLAAREQRLPILHYWVHRQALLLGARDEKLPYAHDAIDALRHAGWSVVVRPFGGLAVPVDSGVLNVSLIMPEDWTLSDMFVLFSELLADACRPAGRVRVGEIAGSYCVGRYDLSIDGVKYAGIAQRRIVGAVVASAFINVFGTALDRISTIRTFYKLAQKDIISTPDSMWIQRDKVGNLAELAAKSVAITDVMEWLQSAIARRSIPLSWPKSLNGAVERHLPEASKRLLQSRNSLDWPAWKRGPS